MCLWDECLFDGCVYVMNTCLGVCAWFVSVPVCRMPVWWVCLYGECLFDGCAFIDNACLVGVSVWCTWQVCVCACMVNVCWVCLYGGMPVWRVCLHTECLFAGCACIGNVCLVSVNVH